MYFPLAKRFTWLSITAWSGMEYSTPGTFFSYVSNQGTACSDGTLWADCIAAIISPAVFAVLSSESGSSTEKIPFRSRKRDMDTTHPMLQNSQYTFIHYHEPDLDGMQRIYYMDSPTRPTKVRMNLADRGIHKDHLTDDNLRYHASHRNLQERQINEELWVDISGGSLANNISPDANNVASLLAKYMVLGLVNYNWNSSCFLVEEYTAQGGLNGIVQIGPSFDNSSTPLYGPAPCGSGSLPTYVQNYNLEVGSCATDGCTAAPIPNS